MNDLLQPDALKNPKVQALKGKVAIIAANNSGTSDRHFTPYSRGPKADQMAGGEIHCNIVETLLSGRYPRAPHAGAVAAAIGAFALLAAALFLRLHPLTGAACGAAASSRLPTRRPSRPFKVRSSSAGAMKCSDTSSCDMSRC